MVIHADQRWLPGREGDHKGRGQPPLTPAERERGEGGGEARTALVPHTLQRR